METAPRQKMSCFHLWDSSSCLLVKNMLECFPVFSYIQWRERSRKTLTDEGKVLVEAGWQAEPLQWPGRQRRNRRWCQRGLVSYWLQGLCDFILQNEQAFARSKKQKKQQQKHRKEKHYADHFFKSQIVKSTISYALHSPPQIRSSLNVYMALFYSSEMSPSSSL